MAEAILEYSEVAEKKRKLEMLEKQYHEELKMEIEGDTLSKYSNNKADDVDEDESEEANDHVDDPIKQTVNNANEVSKPLMSNRKRGLSEAMQRNVIREATAFRPPSYCSAV